MKILTLNCQRGYRKPELEKFIKEAIAQDGYKYFLLQELDKDSAEIFESAGYKLALLDDDLSADSSVALAYKNPPVPTEVFRVPFEKQVTKLHTYSFGLAGIKVDNLIIASVHMPAYFFKAANRRRCLRKIISELSKYVGENAEIIIGGDWNTLWMYERDLLAKMEAPDYKIFKTAQHTYESKYIESGLFWNNVLLLISKLKNFKIITDYFLVRSSAKYRAVLIDERVSDHSPVELTVSS